jgi:hypothetical protein
LSDDEGQVDPEEVIHHSKGQEQVKKIVALLVPIVIGVGLGDMFPELVHVKLCNPLRN